MACGELMEDLSITTTEELVGHLDRIASALESQAETMRLNYEMSIDTAAKTNALTDSMAGMLSNGLSSLLGGEDGDDTPGET